MEFFNYLFSFVLILSFVVFVNEYGQYIVAKKVGVKIESENPFTGDIKHTASAYLTFVSLDQEGRPTEVPDINPETDVEIRRYKEGKSRTMQRKKELGSK